MDIEGEEKKNTILIQAVREFINKANVIKNKNMITNIFMTITRKYKLERIGKNIIRRIYERHLTDIELSDFMKNWLVKKAVRKQSGVLVSTLVLAPEWGETAERKGASFSCSKKCSYCPTETDLSGKPTQPKSYLSSEPAMLRALQYDFDISGQLWDRIKSYIHNGIISQSDLNDKPKCMKLEVILSGGTLECYPKDYLETVFRDIYYAANTFLEDDKREPLAIEEEKLVNETAKFRVIGLTIETRPDFVTKYSILDYLKWGVTRVQIGVQQYDNEILKLVNRECYLKDTIKAIRLLKMCGFKVVVHLMPDLPGSSPEKDLEMFKIAIQNPNVQFDDVKIYPTAVCKSNREDRIVHSDINDWYDSGKYVPYAEKNLDILIDVLMFYLKNMNPWVRIQRLVRDIPTISMIAGYQKKMNLRQMIIDKMMKNNINSNDIRMKEIRDRIFKNEQLRLVVRRYTASQGTEFHISIDCYTKFWYKDVHYLTFLFYKYLMKMFGKNVYYSGKTNKEYEANMGFCRFRLDRLAGGDFVPELKNNAMIREVHVYGNSTSVNTSKTGTVQHRGFGKMLVRVAENLAMEHGYKKIAVIAGIGTRQYYKNKCGYYRLPSQHYMHKDLDINLYNKKKIYWMFVLCCIAGVLNIILYYSINWFLFK